MHKTPTFLASFPLFLQFTALHTIAHLTNVLTGSSKPCDLSKWFPGQNSFLNKTNKNSLLRRNDELWGKTFWREREINASKEIVVTSKYWLQFTVVALTRAVSEPTSHRALETAGSDLCGIHRRQKNFSSTMDQICKNSFCYRAHFSLSSHNAIWTTGSITVLIGASFRAEQRVRLQAVRSICERDSRKWAARSLNCKYVSVICVSSMPTVAVPEEPNSMTYFTFISEIPDSSHCECLVNRTLHIWISSCCQ